LAQNGALQALDFEGKANLAISTTSTDLDITMTTASNFHDVTLEVKGLRQVPNQKKI
jgi:hypothetical protein